MKTSFILWVMEKGKVIGICPSNKAFSIRAVSAILPVDMGAIKVTRIKTGVGEHWKIRRLQ